MITEIAMYCPYCQREMPEETIPDNSGMIKRIESVIKQLDTRAKSCSLDAEAHWNRETGYDHRGEIYHAKDWTYQCAVTLLKDALEGV